MVFASTGQYNFILSGMNNLPLPDQYRAVNKTDVVEIRRNPNSGYDLEPTTLCAVCFFVFSFIPSNLRKPVLSIRT